MAARGRRPRRRARRHRRRRRAHRARRDRVEILHLPGHSLGHVGLFDPADEPRSSATLRWLRASTAGAVAAGPPPYVDLDAYRATIEAIRGLGAARLGTAHFPPFEGEAIGDFLDLSRRFTDELERAVEAAPAVDGDAWRRCWRRWRSGSAAIPRWRSSSPAASAPTWRRAHETGARVSRPGRDAVHAGGGGRRTDRPPPDARWQYQLEACEGRLRHRPDRRRDLRAAPGGGTWLRPVVYDSIRTSTVPNDPTRP